MAIEYPESSIISNQMRQVLPEQKIAQVLIQKPDSAVFRWGFSNLNQVDLCGEVIHSIRQFGDYIFVEMDEYALLFGDMIGKILYHAAGEKQPPKATILFRLNNGAAFSYNPTLYGYCKALTRQEAAAFFPNSWIEPLDTAFTPDYLAAAFAESERKIAKQMNVYHVNYKVVGVGNSYWQEILYECKIHPKRKAKEITSNEIEQLVTWTQKIMRAAVQKGGSADEKDFFNQSGGYIRAMSGRLKDQPCPVCGTFIQGQNILGANVYFCSSCQK